MKTIALNFLAVLMWLSSLSMSHAFIGEDLGIVAKKRTALDIALQESKLKASGVEEADRFGSSISLDGDRALVGAWADSSNAGVVYVFEFDANAWVQTAKFSASDTDPGDAFGISVSLDGDRALIGAYGDDDEGGGAGAAYVFEFDGTNWNETRKLTASDAATNHWFGSDVILESNRALVGAPLQIGNTGAVYVFDFDGAEWNESAKLTASDAAPDSYFGGALSLSGDRLLVGAYGDDGFSGAAYVFDLSGVDWNETQKLTASDSNGFDLFGSALSLDGHRAVIGANGDDAAGSSSGAAYVFDFDGIGWNESTKLSPLDAGPNTYFGQSVSLDGDRVLVGAIGGDSYTGAAYVFEYSVNSWVEGQKVRPSGSMQDDWFGTSVKLDGDRAFIAALSNRNGDSHSGSAHIFELGGTGWFDSATFVSSVASIDARFGNSLSVDGSRALVGAPGKNAERGVVYVFEWKNWKWVQTATLNPSQTAGVKQFGWSVSLDGDRALVGALRDDGSSHVGKAYIFDLSGSIWTESAVLESSDLTENFGYSVSLDGARAFIGANRDSGAASKGGSVYVFERDEAGWSEFTEIYASDASAGARFGNSIALEGNRALIGASLADGNEGAVYALEYSAGAWHEMQKITASDAALETGVGGFGGALAMDGDRAIVGAYGRNGYAGAAYVLDFDSISGAWDESMKLTASDAATNDFFGASVSLADDRVLIGAWKDIDNGIESGSAYLFELDGLNWEETGKLTALDQADGDRYGAAVSVEGGRLLIGAHGDDLSTGATYAYDLDTVFHDNFE